MYIKKGIDKALTADGTRFFMPGHRGEGQLDLRYDVTEIDGTDNLQKPDGIIQLAQLNSAVAFGALQSFFLVNGSSVGLHALIMSVCSRGDRLIVDRGCHISVINALVLNGIVPIFAEPEFNAVFGITAGVSNEAVCEAYKACPEAMGVLITSPNYYGVCSDLGAIAETVHSFGGVLLVDEAHGAHFAFNERLPKTALFCGADGVVQSAHKTLPCITQGALLHLGSKRINADTVRENLNMLQTTSPSYLIMSSIDEAVGYMQDCGKERLDFAIDACDKIRAVLDGTGKYKCLSGGDPTRLTVHIGEKAAEVESRLRKLHGVPAEMCDGLNLVFIAKAAHEQKDFRRLERGLRALSLILPKLSDVKYTPPPIGRAVMAPAEAYYSRVKTIPPTEAVGQVAARAVYKMPPCICLLCPGEIVTEHAVRLIEHDITIVD